MPFSALVTGGNRGIGLELVRRLACGPEPADHVFATCRNMDDCKDLQDIQKKNNNLHILQLDVVDEASYPRVVSSVRDVVQESGLNLLINNAGVGIMHKLEEVTSEDMMRVYRTNTVAPTMITQAFLPLLRAAAATGSGDTMSWKRAAVVNISSRMGSIDDNGMGKFYEYRASKVALNGVTRSMGIDLRPDHVLAVSVDPGWVRTRMGGQNGKITAEESASRIVTTLGKLSNEHTATYIDNLGKPIPW